MADDNPKDRNENIIELSEIAVGTSAEDEAIIELTEDLVAEARNAISGATGETEQEARELEITQGAEEEPAAAFGQPGAETAQSGPEGQPDLFDAEESLGIALPAEKIALTRDRVEAAVERVVERKYGAIIEQVLNEVIKHKVCEDIERLKEYLLGRQTGR